MPTPATAVRMASGERGAGDAMGWLALFETRSGSGPGRRTTTRGAGGVPCRCIGLTCWPCANPVKPRTAAVAHHRNDPEGRMVQPSTKRYATSPDDSVGRSLQLVGPAFLSYMVLRSNIPASGSGRGYH